MQSAGVTVAAQDLTTHALFTIRRNRKEMSFKKIYKECSLLAQLGHHDNIVEFLGGVVDEATTALQPFHVCKIMLECSECK